MKPEVRHIFKAKITSVAISPAPNGRVFLSSVYDDVVELLLQNDHGDRITHVTLNAKEFINVADEVKASLTLQRMRQDAKGGNDEEEN